jgi:hypothetical protein
MRERREVPRFERGEATVCIMKVEMSDLLDELQ